MRYLTALCLAGVTGLVGVASVTGSRPDRSKQPEVPLSREQMQEIEGGLVATVAWPASANASQSYDNLAFNVELVNTLQTPTVHPMLYADETKVGHASVATPAPDYEGQLARRTMWPYPGYRDLEVRYGYAGQIWTAGVLNNQRLLPNVKVHELRFWNLSDADGDSVSVANAPINQVVDRLNDYVYGVGDNSVDAIYGQCPNNGQAQFRKIGNIQPMFVNGDCVDTSDWNTSHPELPPDSICAVFRESCTNKIFDQVLDADPNLQRLHIVFVEELNCGTTQWGGAHLLGDDYSANSTDPEDKPYMIAIEASNTANLDGLTRLLAHEIGHTYLGGHVNDDSPELCSTGSSTTNNVMCRGTGRQLLASQCQNAADNDDIRYRDHN
ncbi:MAG: hypothetical protein OXU20_24190 [Myxococcales bacterium]|nr:hypothetical protein [Myxococcales bacterium]MDD9967213.1 hypothetical protein [Myxococcales bacterium]